MGLILELLYLSAPGRFDPVVRSGCELPCVRMVGTMLVSNNELIAYSPLVFVARLKGLSMALGDELPDLLTVREAAEFLRVTPLTIKRWGKKGKLQPIRINSRGDRRYTKEQVLWLVGKSPD